MRDGLLVLGAKPLHRMAPVRDVSRVFWTEAGHAPYGVEPVVARAHVTRERQAQEHREQRCGDPPVERFASGRRHDVRPREAIEHLANFRL